MEPQPQRFPTPLLIAATRIHLTDADPSERRAVLSAPLVYHGARRLAYMHELLDVHAEHALTEHYVQTEVQRLFDEVIAGDVQARVALATPAQLIVGAEDRHGIGIAGLISEVLRTEHS